MGGNRSFGEIRREIGVFSRKIIQSRPGTVTRRYRWAFPFIILLLVILYYPAGKIFHEPLSTVFLEPVKNWRSAIISASSFRLLASKWSPPEQSSWILTSPVRGQPIIVWQPAVISARTVYFVPLVDTHVAGAFRFKQS